MNHLAPVLHTQRLEALRAQRQWPGPELAIARARARTCAVARGASPDIRNATDAGLAQNRRRTRRRPR